MRQRVWLSLYNLVKGDPRPGFEYPNILKRGAFNYFKFCMENIGDRLLIGNPEDMGSLKIREICYT